MSDVPVDGPGDFHLQDGIHFTRADDGKVVIYRDDAEKGRIVLVEAEAGGWISAVLSVTAFGERPGDWYPMMDHHMGRKDALAGQRGGY